VVAGLGIIPLAMLLGRATDSIAIHLGPAAGGLLNATFGNAAELILGLVALRRGLLELVKASLIGSIIGNALLVLGMSLLVGGLRHRRQAFDRVSAALQANLLVLAAVGLCVPSILFHALGPSASTRFSTEVAAIFLVTYFASLFFSLVTHREKKATAMLDAGNGRSLTWQARPALLVLFASTTLIALLSEILVGAVETAQHTGYLERLGMSELFLGVIVVAFIGNAAEHSTAIWMAHHNKVGVTLHIAVGSGLQIALLVTPVLVFASLALAPEPLELNFTVLEMLALGASVIVVALVATDGESHWMEGILLLAVYLILALAFYHFPSPGRP
jgi:Ca2+:H+ antiporter